MHPISVDDTVSSVGRILVLQDGRKRYITFGAATVTEVSDAGITVNPVGKRMLVLCRPQDLDLVEVANHELEQTPASDASAELQAEQHKPAMTETSDAPEGSMPITPKPKAKPKPKTIQQKREQEDKAADKPKPKPRPRRRRDR